MTFLDDSSAFINADAPKKGGCGLIANHDAIEAGPSEHGDKERDTDRP